jgi:molecular chaperone DnaK
MPLVNPSSPIIGIDLGTTVSCAAIVRNGRPHVISSCPRRADRRSDSIASKHVAQGSDALREQNHRLSCADAAGRLASLEQDSAQVLRRVKEVAQDHLAEPVNRAVITVPAFYGERQREAVRRAGARAGFRVERLVNEPTAAAIAYAAGRGLQERILVYALRGDRFEASILEVNDDVFEVVSSRGEALGGGLSFDDRVVGLLLDRHAREAGQAFAGDSASFSRIVDAADRAKRELADREEVRIHLPFLAMANHQPVTLDVTLTRSGVAQLMTPLADRTLEVVQDVLAAKRLEPGDIDQAMLVGSESRLPLFHERVGALFGKSQSPAVHAEHSFALGAALLGATLDAVDGVVLMEVLPTSIGVLRPDGTVRKVFDRNVRLPACKQYTLGTSRDDQRELELTIVQGEGATREGYEYLGTARFEDLRRGPRGSVQTTVSFELGVECDLTVSARDVLTNREIRSTFEMLDLSAQAPEEQTAASRLVTTDLRLSPPHSDNAAPARSNGRNQFAAR